MDPYQRPNTGAARRAGFLSLLLAPSLLISCGVKAPVLQAVAYLNAETLISCAHPVILNHGPDPVQLGTVQIPVGGQAGLPVLPRPNTPTITVDRSLHTGSEVHNDFDLGFRCSDNAPELRQRYPLLSLLIFSLDASAPSGLSVEVRQVDLPD